MLLYAVRRKLFLKTQQTDHIHTANLHLWCTKSQLYLGGYVSFSSFSGGFFQTFQRNITPWQCCMCLFHSFQEEACCLWECSGSGCGSWIQPCWEQVLHELFPQLCQQSSLHSSQALVSSFLAVSWTAWQLGQLSFVLIKSKLD